MLSQPKTAIIVQDINSTISELLKLSTRLLDPRRMGLKDSKEDAATIFEDIVRAESHSKESLAGFLEEISPDMADFAFSFHTFLRKGCDSRLACFLHNEINRNSVGWVQTLRLCGEGVSTKLAKDIIPWFTLCDLDRISDFPAVGIVALIKLFCQEYPKEIGNFIILHDQEV